MRFFVTVLSMVCVLVLIAGCLPVRTGGENASIRETANDTTVTANETEQLREELEQVKNQLEELKNKSETVQPPTPPAPPKITTDVKVPSMSREMKKIIDQIKGIYDENYIYYYISPDHGTEADHYYVLDDKIRIDLFDTNIKTTGEYYNTVYLDRKQQIALGYCLGRYAYCPQGKGPFELNYDAEITETPKEWSKKITSGEIFAYDSERERPITVVITTLDDVPAEVSLDSFYALPLVITLNPGSEGFEKVYKFQDLLVGDVKESDVLPPRSSR